MVERIIYLGEPRTIPKSDIDHKKELIHELIEVGSGQADMLKGINQDKNDGGWLEAI